MLDAKRVTITRVIEVREEMFVYYPSISELCFKGMDKAVREAAETINEKRK